MIRASLEQPEDLSPGAVYTLQEVCRLLRISEATARRWIKDGRLPGRRIGRDYRFLGRDLLDALEGVPGALRSAGLLRRFGPQHPLLGLAGIGESGRSDIAEQHDRYLAGLSRPKP